MEAVAFIDDDALPVYDYGDRVMFLDESEVQPTYAYRYHRQVMEPGDLGTVSHLNGDGWGSGDGKFAVWVDWDRRAGEEDEDIPAKAFWCPVNWIRKVEAAR